jgi:Glyoxalase/Bleomycin resistance protein/Dioxygenase superfamily
VTFAVEDADGTAAKATELGGKVIVPPFDAPWVRMTIINDPQGATFIASKFVPENKAIALSTSRTIRDVSCEELESSRLIESSASFSWKF